MIPRTRETPGLRAEDKKKSRGKKPERAKAERLTGAHPGDGGKRRPAGHRRQKGPRDSDPSEQKQKQTAEMQVENCGKQERQVPGQGN